MENAKGYHGNLRVFLDNMMRQFNSQFVKSEDTFVHLYEVIINTIEVLKRVFGNYSLIGRRINNGEFEPRFNRVLLEVQVYYFCHIPTICLKDENNQVFMDLFIQLCDQDQLFRASVERSTKSMENYKVRYSKFQEIVNNAYNCDLNINPFADANI